mgnify:CR=1 FL=1
MIRKDHLCCCDMVQYSSRCLTAAIAFIWLYTAADFSEVVNLSFPGFLVLRMQYDGAIRGKRVFAKLTSSYRSWTWKLPGGMTLFISTFGYRHILQPPRFVFSLDVQVKMAWVSHFVIVQMMPSSQAVIQKMISYAKGARDLAPIYQANVGSQVCTFAVSRVPRIVPRSRGSHRKQTIVLSLPKWNPISVNCFFANSTPSPTTFLSLSSSCLSALSFLPFSSLCRCKFSCAFASSFS